MAIADTAKLVVQLDLNDRLSAGLGRISGQLKGMQAGFAQAGKGVGQIGAGLARIGTLAATGFVVGVGTAIKVAGDFEAQLNTINTIVKLNDQQLTTLGEGIRSTFRETGVPLDELTSGYYDLLSAGIKLTDAQNALNLAVKLGIGGLGTTQEAVNLLTTAINTYKLDQQGAAAASDIFAQTVADGVIKVSELQGAFADVAPIATVAGVSIKELGAGFAVLTTKGTLASEAGTQLNRAILELYKPTGDLAKIQDKLGGSFRDLIRQRGLVQTLEDIRIEAAKNGQTFFDLFGRIEGAKAATNLTGAAFADFTAEMKRMDGAAGELNEQFGERQKGLNFQLGVLKANVQDAGITIGTALLPKLTDLSTKLNDFLAANQDKIATFADKFATGLGDVFDRIAKIDFSGVTGGLKILADVGKRVVDTFLSLPPDIQAYLVTGLALNKLSGGLLGKGAANIAGGLFKIVFERGASPANPLWVASATGGVGGGGLPVAGGLPAIGLGTAAIAGLLTGAVAAIIYKAEQESQTPFGKEAIRQHSSMSKFGTNAPLNIAGTVAVRDLQTMTAAATREGTVPLVSAFERSRATSAQLNNVIQAEAARRSSDASRMLDSLRATASATERTAAKDFSPSFTATLTTNVRAYLSVSQALYQMSTYSQIREG